MVGIHSALFLQCVAFLMCLTLLLGLITRSFGDDHARSVLCWTKKTLFFLGFTMLNAIVAPIAFLIMGSIISTVPGDLKWGSIAFLIGIFPFVSIVIFLSATKDMFRGLKQEIRFNRPLSIL